MKNNLFILLVFSLICFLSKEAHSRGAPYPKKPPTMPAQTATPGSGIHFSPVRNYTFEETQVLAVAESLANKLVKSSCFENFMVKRNLIETNGKTALEVVNVLKTSDLTIPVEMYYKNNNVVGYRQPPAPDIYTNRKFHAGSNACARGSNITHEWSHTAGFSHAYRATKSRPFSVPYSINAAYVACCFCEKNSITNCQIKP